MKLIIAEKPAVGKAIVKAIAEKVIEENSRSIKILYKNKEYIITWANGHLLRLKEPDEMEERYKLWRLDDLPIFFENWEKAIRFKKEENKSKKEDEKVIKEPDEWAIVQLELIRKYITSDEIDEIIHAGDPDDEGQYIVDEILEYFNNKKKVKRVLINDNTPETIVKAFQKIEDNNKFINLGKAAYGRAIGDIVYGINASRFFTCYYNAQNISKKTLTVGRVQTPTLALVVNRDNEIEGHKKSKYYELFAKTNIKGNDVNLKFVPSKDNPNLVEKYIEDKNYLVELGNKLKGNKKEIEITKKDTIVAPPLPFATTKLQMEINNKFGYSSDETLKITQKLKDPPLNAITYNRSDCPYLNDEHFEKAPEVIKNVLKVLNITVENLDFSEENKSSAFDSSKVEVHHAIIPTGYGDMSAMTEKEKNVYKVIADRYIAQFLPKAKKNITEAKVEIENEGILKARSEVLTEKGFLEYLKDMETTEEQEEKEDSGKLSDIAQGTYNEELQDPKILEKETKPKPRYTEASLLNDMTSISKYVKDKELQEALRKKDKDKKDFNGSIGTPATQGKIIAYLFRRGYLERKGKQVFATELAKEYLKALPEEMKTADMTAKWWLIQEQIKAGNEAPETLINSVLENIKEIISKEYKEVEFKEAEKEVIGKCLYCGKDVYEGEKNFYCCDYKNCDFKLWKKMKRFSDELTIPKAKAKSLLNGKKAIFSVTGKEDKKYDGYFELIITEKDGKKYPNLKLNGYPEKKKK